MFTDLHKMLVGEWKIDDDEFYGHLNLKRNGEFETSMLGKFDSGTWDITLVNVENDCFPYIYFFSQGEKVATVMFHILGDKLVLSFDKNSTILRRPSGSGILYM